MNESSKLPTPLNANEHLLYAIVVRQDIIIEQLSSIVEHLSTKDNVAVTKNTRNEVLPTKVEAKQEAKSEAKPAPRKRSPRKSTVKE